MQGQNFIVEVVFTLLAGASSIATMYCFYRGMVSISGISKGETKQHVWDLWFAHVKWICGFLLIALITAIFWPSILSGIYVVIGAGVFILVLGAVQMSLVLRRFGQENAGRARSAKSVSGDQVAEVKKLQPGRLRRLDDQGANVIFGEAEVDQLQGVIGKVTMLSYELSKELGSFMPSGVVPVMYFEAEDGTDFMIYRDDHVDLAA